MSQRLLTIDQRRDLLDAEVTRWVKQGWRLSARTDITAQLVKPRSVNLLLFIILLLLFVFPGLLYWLLYKGDRGLYILVEESGRIERVQAE